jgi:hypothetical protein
VSASQHENSLLAVFNYEAGGGEQRPQTTVAPENFEMSIFSSVTRQQARNLEE